MAKIWHGPKITEFQDIMPMKRHHHFISLASNPTIQRPHLPRTEQEENADQNQLCENRALTRQEMPPQSSLRALFSGMVPKLGFPTTVTHCKLRRTKAREQRDPLREGRRLEREETTDRKGQHYYEKQTQEHRDIAVFSV